MLAHEYTLDERLADSAAIKRVLVISEQFNFGARSGEMGDRMRQRLEDSGDSQVGSDHHLSMLLFYSAFSSNERILSCGIDVNALGVESLNLCWPAANGRFDADHAKVVAEAVRRRIWDKFRVVVLCGKRVAAAFGFDHLEAPSLWTVGQARMLLMPCPSKNWNESDMVTRDMVTRVRELYERAAAR